ncbi:MAG TPA: NUDIX hydrolase [Candidatus Paceibacterota bacterium]|nr:NUDIX hydrolase [Candidatus Paceibacterota bacterium]
MDIPATFYRVSCKALIFDESGTKFAVTLEDNGWWELPGGGLDWGETPQECIRREVREETGLEITEIDPLPSHYLIGKNMAGYQSLNLVFKAKIKDINFTPTPECLELRFISPEEIDTINAFRNVRELAAQLLRN